MSKIIGINELDDLNSLENKLETIPKNNRKIPGNYGNNPRGCLGQLAKALAESN